jgi:hypothetical protein
MLFWDRDRSFAQEHWGADTKGNSDSSWDKCPFDKELDGDSIHHLSAYFTILYGLYPINFLDYIRKPHRYLRHANNAEYIDVQATEIRERSERFRSCHLLHPNFYQLTIESEKTDFSRWMKSEPAEVITDCMNLCISPRAAAGPDTEGEISVLPLRAAAISPSDHDREDTTLGMPLLSSPVTGSSQRDSKSSDPRHTSIASLSTNDGVTHLDLARKVSQSSHPSLDTHPRDTAGDSPTLPPALATSSSHTHLQDMITSNKVIKTSLHQSLGNGSAASLALSHVDSLQERHYLQLQGSHPHHHPHSPTTADLLSQIAQLQRVNLLLQNDLNFERYMKQQHMTHIGALRRKQLREAATEAETQNLLLANRSLKHQLSETKKAEARVRKEAENRRAMATKWEAQLTDRLKHLREEQRRWTTEENVLKRELEGARSECERLAGLVGDAEARYLRVRQDSEAFEGSVEEIRRLEEEVGRLAAVERRYQGLENEMKAKMEEAAGAEARAEERLMEMVAREGTLVRERERCENEIGVLKAQLAEKEKGEGKAAVEGRAAVEKALQTALANLQAKHAELQRQYGMLRRKYTVAQGSLLDLQCEVAEKQRAAERGLAPKEDREAGPVGIRNRGQRGLSDPETTFEATSYNATAPLEPVSSSLGAAGLQRPATPTRAGAGPADGGASPQERYYGRGTCFDLGMRNSRSWLTVV